MSRHAITHLSSDPVMSGLIEKVGLRIWPWVLTSGAPRLFFNRVWSSVPEVREDLLRCAGIKHVVIAEEGALDMGDLKTRVSTPIHVLTLSTAKSVPERILVNCGCVQRAKRPGNRGFGKKGRPMDWTFLALASRTKHRDGAVGQI
jgi:hypothetical protein